MRGLLYIRVKAVCAKRGLISPPFFLFVVFVLGCVSFTRDHCLDGRIFTPQTPSTTHSLRHPIYFTQIYNIKYPHVFSKRVVFPPQPFTRSVVGPAGVLCAFIRIAGLCGSVGGCACINNYHFFFVSLTLPSSPTQQSTYTVPY